MMRDDAQRPIVQRSLELIVVVVERRGFDVAKDRPQSRLDDCRRSEKQVYAGMTTSFRERPSDTALAFSAINVMVSAAVPEDTRNACETPKSSRI